MPIVQESDEEYHASTDSVSKSGLWELWTKTPFHYRYGKKEFKPQFSIGKAAHIAILEPERFEEAVCRGPATRRGNAWKDAEAFAAHAQMILLTESDFELALLMRDTADTIPQLQQMRRGNYIVERSAYHVDPETGVEVRCRPDQYNLDNKIILDLKSAASAAYPDFQRAVGQFGYHVQDAVYSDVWPNAGGGDVEGFFFLVIEKSEPPTFALYEIDAAAAKEGHAVYRAALEKYAQCAAKNEWPGYPTDIQTINLRRWDYHLTEPPQE